MLNAFEMWCYIKLPNQKFLDQLIIPLYLLEIFQMEKSYLKVI